LRNAKRNPPQQSAKERPPESTISTRKRINPDAAMTVRPDARKKVKNGPNQLKTGPTAVTDGNSSTKNQQ
jgi:hypothetical protein